jgi:hypothetical protein
MRTTESRGDLKGGTSRFISIVGIFGLIVGLGAVASRPARAEIQNDLVGFSPNHVFESGDAGEHIDVLTGNLTLTIPIGPRYKLTDNFSYGVTLYYNSKIWEHECPQGKPSQDNPCPGTLPAYNTYGVGFSLLPGRVYHHLADKDYVYRIQLEDGSEHFFCDTQSTAYPQPPYDPWACTPPPTCDQYTTDATHIKVEPHTFAGQPSAGWIATTTDGRTIEFGKVLDTTHEALATRVATTAERSAGVPFAWVDYRYLTSPDAYSIQDIKDSQDRTIAFSYAWSGQNYDVSIRVPAFGPSETLQGSTTASYVLHVQKKDAYLKDPSHYVNTFVTTRVLRALDLPPVQSVPTGSYQFVYERAEWPWTYGWLLQRTLPTGARIDHDEQFPPLPYGAPLQEVDYGPDRDVARCDLPMELEPL